MNYTNYLCPLCVSLKDQKEKLPPAWDTSFMKIEM